MRFDENLVTIFPTFPPGGVMARVLDAARAPFSVQLLARVLGSSPPPLGSRNVVLLKSDKTSSIFEFDSFGASKAVAAEAPGINEAMTAAATPTFRMFGTNWLFPFR